MKPLIVTTVYNRATLTARMLESLSAMTDLHEAVTVVMDNGSTDGAAEVVAEWRGQHEDEGEIHVYHLEENLGTARAINYAMTRHREPGQPLIKIDNDVVLLNPWLEDVKGLVETLQGRYDLALVRAYRLGLPGEEPKRVGVHRGEAILQVQRALGYTVWYTGAFMDRVGHFEVLHEDHLYGFDDTIMHHKANVLGWVQVIWGGWQVEDIQRGSAVKNKEERVRKSRPLFNRRVMELYRGGPIWAGPDGRPVSSLPGGTR